MLAKLLKRLHAGQIIGLVVIVYLVVYLVQTIKHNYELQRQISDLQGQISSLKDESDTLKYQIQYYNSDSYKEKQARAKLGLQQPGEGVIILPHSQQPATTPAPKPKPLPKKTNLQQWVDFLAGRS
jgi:cell division protein FtsB